ncbi:RNA-binding transcriptional accessory protein [Gammaproteobacteria bacterium]|nr:RNA-binding transcriptional accessory protein [bacterium]MDA9035156.1 RNA-binding transcriptional accessory protein [bacterium]MDC1528151.1 RNA-binding transcriptional accessory protein [Gammaproteobacteria bacterium]
MSTTNTLSPAITQKIASELNVRPQQVSVAITLLDEGSTVPFISRYRKEATGGLDDLQLRDLELRLRYLREMDERIDTILASIGEQEKLTPALEKQIRNAETKTELEDLYLPYKPKRRTKAMIAIEAGLEPLADKLFADPSLDPQVQAAQFIVDGFDDTKAVLDGARDILMERFSEDAALMGRLRKHLWDNGELRASVVEKNKADAAKFTDYFDYAERMNKIPSHRALAVFRGRKEGFLTVDIGSAGVESGATDPCEGMIGNHFGIENKNRPADKWLGEVVTWTWRVKLIHRLETDLLGQLREQSDDEAIRVFTENMKAILLAPPAGNKVTLGLDPGLRTGVKVCVVDRTGKFLEDTAIYPHQPRNQWDESIDVLAKLAKKHGVELIAIGNGTASRETDKLAGELIKKHKELKLDKAMVNEAGASVYSASDIAREEFPDLDVTVRGAISIARRLQDPLAELVKLDPKSIGVGQYQHDVSQFKLGKSLNAVVEDCVNAVGVDVNMASAALLQQVSGLSASIASNIVEYRNQHGAFKNRNGLKVVPRFGDKSFEQAAGFLRIRDSDNPLDGSAVHPESYSVVEKICSVNKKKVNELIGDHSFLSKLNPADFTDEKFGLPTVTDIIAELEKPGRDPRPEFKTAEFKDGIESMKDLKEGMKLEGVITNVTNFGAFVDIGVHQDGLVHISALANKFIKDPHTVVKTGDVVKVKVMEVDVQRKRIALSMRLDDEVDARASCTDLPARNERKNRVKAPAQSTSAKPAMGSMGALLMNAQSAKDKKV